MESSEDVLPVSINFPEKWEPRDGTHSEVSRRLSAPETPRLKKRSPTVGHFITQQKAQLADDGKGWYGQMVRYASVLVEGGHVHSILSHLQATYMYTLYIIYIHLQS